MCWVHEAELDKTRKAVYGLTLTGGTDASMTFAADGAKAETNSLVSVNFCVKYIVKR